MLLRNERDGWEPSGGKIEISEAPEECPAREIEEETGRPVEMAAVLDSWMHHITRVDRHVFIVTYGAAWTSGHRSWSPASERQANSVLDHLSATPANQAANSTANCGVRCGGESLTPEGVGDAA
ncbi:NUDIX domain-containing protein [Nocardiopsis flavescens]